MKIFKMKKTTKINFFLLCSNFISSVVRFHYTRIFKTRFFHTAFAEVFL